MFKHAVELEEDVRCSSKVRNFAPIIIDEAPDLGRADAAANPVELLLVALGTCQEIMYSAYASVMGIQINSIKVNLRGYLGLFGLDPGIHLAYQKVVFETLLDSPADMEILKKLMGTVESHCPVMDALMRAFEVSGH